MTEDLIVTIRHILYVLCGVCTSYGALNGIVVTIQTYTIPNLDARSITSGMSVSLFWLVLAILLWLMAG